MKKILVVLLLVTSLFADRDGGPYIGLGYGTSKYNDDGLYTTLKSDTSTSATIYGGAYINKYFSVELGYASFDASSNFLNSWMSDKKVFNSKGKFACSYAMVNNHFIPTI